MIISYLVKKTRMVKKTFWILFRLNYEREMIIGRPQDLMYFCNISIIKLICDGLDINNLFDNL